MRSFKLNAFSIWLCARSITLRFKNDTVIRANHLNEASFVGSKCFSYTQQMSPIGLSKLTVFALQLGVRYSI